VRKQNKAHLRELQQSLDDPLLLAKVKAYIPGAVLRTLKQESPEDEYWSSELRRTSVMFVSLGLREQHLLAAAKYDEAMQEVHRVMVAAQESVYEYEGSINKCLMDDKGALLLLVHCIVLHTAALQLLFSVGQLLRMCTEHWCLIVVLYYSAVNSRPNSLAYSSSAYVLQLTCSCFT
jgi:hypothetical protein